MKAAVLCRFQKIEKTRKKLSTAAHERELRSNSSENRSRGQESQRSRSTLIGLPQLV